MINKAIITILLIFTPFLSYSQVKKQEDNYEKYNVDLLNELESLKIFTVNSKDLPYAGKNGYNIEYVIELFYNSYKKKDNIFIINEKARERIKNEIKGKKILKYKRKILQNITIEPSRESDVRLLSINGLQSDRIISYFVINKPQYSGYIYQSISNDNGKTWSPPTIAIKHNLFKLKGWDIIEPKININKYGVIAILTNENNEIYLSRSKDKGSTWSYPLALFNNINGSYFRSSIYKKSMVLIFKNNKDYDEYKKGEILLWAGKVKNILKDKRTGYLIKVSNSCNVNERWKINHVSSNEVIIIKTTETENGKIIDGYLVSLSDFQK